MIECSISIHHIIPLRDYKENHIFLYNKADRTRRLKVGFSSAVTGNWGLQVIRYYKLLGVAIPSIYSYTNLIIKVHHTF